MAAGVLTGEHMEIKQNIPAEACFRYMEGMDFPYQYHPAFARRGITRSYVMSAAPGPGRREE